MRRVPVSQRSRPHASSFVRFSGNIHARDHPRSVGHGEFCDMELQHRRESSPLNSEPIRYKTGRRTNFGHLRISDGFGEFSARSNTVRCVRRVAFDQGLRSTTFSLISADFGLASPIFGWARLSLGWFRPSSFNAKTLLLKPSAGNIPSRGVLARRSVGMTGGTANAPRCELNSTRFGH